MPRTHAFALIALVCFIAPNATVNAQQTPYPTPVPTAGAGGVAAPGRVANRVPIPTPVPEPEVFKAQEASPAPAPAANNAAPAPFANTPGPIAKVATLPSANLPPGGAGCGTTGCGTNGCGSVGCSTNGCGSTGCGTAYCGQDCVGGYPGYAPVKRDCRYYPLFDDIKPFGCGCGGGGMTRFFNSIFRARTNFCGPTGGTPACYTGCATAPCGTSGCGQSGCTTGCDSIGCGTSGCGESGCGGTVACGPSVPCQSGCGGSGCGVASGNGCGLGANGCGGGNCGLFGDKSCGKTSLSGCFGAGGLFSNCSSSGFGSCLKNGSCLSKLSCFGTDECGNRRGCKLGSCLKGGCLSGCKDGCGFACLRGKGYPDTGWSPPASVPIIRNNAQYTHWWPQQWYGSSGFSAVPHPMVYMPTDTTQLGFGYMQVPMWRRTAANYPPIPDAAMYHTRMAPMPAPYGYPKVYQPIAVPHHTGLRSKTGWHASASKPQSQEQYAAYQRQQSERAKQQAQQAARARQYQAQRYHEARTRQASQSGSLPNIRPVSSRSPR